MKGQRSTTTVTTDRSANSRNQIIPGEGEVAVGRTRGATIEGPEGPLVQKAKIIGDHQITTISVNLSASLAQVVVLLSQKL